jgi:hypothetical protein
MNPSNGNLDCFGQLGGVLRREAADDALYDATLSGTLAAVVLSGKLKCFADRNICAGSNYVVATSNDIYFRTLRYLGAGLLVEPSAETDSWRLQSNAMMEILLMVTAALLPVLLRMDSSAVIRVHLVPS